MNLRFLIVIVLAVVAFALYLIHESAIMNSYELLQKRVLVQAFRIDELNSRIEALEHPPLVITKDKKQLKRPRK